jgi:hypothetical protein
MVDQDKRIAGRLVSVKCLEVLDHGAADASGQSEASQSHRFVVTIISQS